MPEHPQGARRGCIVAVVFAATVTTLVSPSPATAADIDTLIARLQTAHRDATSTSSAASYQSSMQSDGCYGDVDYADTARTSWKPSRHLSRLKALAAAYTKSGHALHQSAAALDALRRGLDCWYQKAPTSSNWWHNEIGKQLSLGPIGVLLEAHLGQPRKQKIINDLQSAVASKYTGQNRVWIAQNVVLRGCLERKTTGVDAGLAAIKSTVVVSSAEGIQADHSFHQHGPMLYNAGYGLAFIADTSRWAHYTRNTQFAFGVQAVDILLGLLLEGDRWMVRGKMFDYSADGREIARPGQSASALVGAARRLADVAPARATELEALATHIEGKTAPPVTGNRHFWRGDLMTHHRPGYYASVKLASSRTYGTECINQENLKGNWLPFGLTYIARPTDEYKDIFPLWDWTHLPGVTNPATTSCPKAGYAKSTFAGGVSDGRHGVAAMVLDAEKTTGKKAWFFFDEELVALGAAISSSHGTTVTTTLNQSWLQSSGVVVDGVTQAKGERSLGAVGWVFHDGVGYLLPQKTDLVVHNRAVSGSWKSINASGSASIITKDVFALWIDHGKAPQGASYAYAVVPDTTQPAFVAGYSNKPPFTIVDNSASKQAVRHHGDELLGVVFHQAGSLTSGDVTLTVDKACLLLLDLSDPGQTTVFASNPHGKATTVALKLRRGAVANSLSLSLDGTSIEATVTHPAPPTDGGATDKGKDAGVGDAGADDGDVHDGNVDAASADGSSDGSAAAEQSSGSSLDGGCALGGGSPGHGGGLIWTIWLAALLLLRRQRGDHTFLALLCALGVSSCATTSPAPRWATPASQAKKNSNNAPSFACRYSAAPWQGAGQRLRAQPKGAVFALVRQDSALRATLAIPLGKAEQGVALDFRHPRGLRLRAFSAGRPLVALFPRKPLHFGAVVVARSGLPLRWLGSPSPGRLEVTPAWPLKHLTLTKLPRLEVPCAAVGPAPLDYPPAAREKALLDLVNAKAGYRLLGGMKIPLAGGPGAATGDSLFLPHDKRGGVLLRARRPNAYHVFVAFRGYALDAWVPHAAVRPMSYPMTTKQRAWPSRWVPRYHQVKVGNVPRTPPGMRRYRCGEALKVFLRQGGHDVEIGSYDAHRELRVIVRRGLWARLDPSSVPWLVLMPGAELMVSRAPLSRCQRLDG